MWNSIADWIAPAAIAVVLTMTIGLASAQEPVEENAPPVQSGPQLSNLPISDKDLSSDASDAPLGVILRSIVILDRADGSAKYSMLSGVDTSQASVPSTVNLQTELNPYLKSPLSLRLIVDIRSTIVRAYRRAGRALVTVSVPPQEISGGTLKLVVRQARLGDKRAEGNMWTSDEHILHQIRAQHGDEIDTNQLIEDLNWLNLNPYRNLVVIAEPGKAFGETNLVFRSNETKPWSAYFGYNNQGTEQTDRNRILAGIHIANLPFTDHQLSYQFTTSPDAFDRIDQTYSHMVKQAAYQSHDGYYFAPLPWRHKLRIRGAFIKSRSNLTDPLVSESETSIASADYAVPLPARPWLIAETFAKIEYKHANRDTYNAGVLAAQVAIDVLQGAVGVRGQQNDRLGQTEFDLRFVHSPGEMTPHNSDADFAAFSGNPEADSKYSYFYGNVKRTTRLPFGLEMVTQLIGQLSDEALPTTESFAVGGRDTVRGYEISEVSGDSGIVLRSELHFDLLDKIGHGMRSFLREIDLFVFADRAYVRDAATKMSETLASVGGGVNVGLTNHFSISADVGVVLNETAKSDEGDTRANVSGIARF